MRRISGLIWINSYAWIWPGFRKVARITQPMRGWENKYERGSKNHPLHRIAPARLDFCVLVTPFPIHETALSARRRQRLYDARRI